MKNATFAVLLLLIMAQTARSGCGTDAAGNYCEGKIQYAIAGIDTASTSYEKGFSYIRMDVTDNAYFWADSTMSHLVLGIAAAAVSNNMEVTLRFKYDEIGSTTNDGNGNVKKITSIALKTY